MNNPEYTKHWIYYYLLYGNCDFADRMRPIGSC